jgi:hypothetical protein
MIHMMLPDLRFTAQSYSAGSFRFGCPYPMSWSLTLLHVDCECVDR